MLGGCQPKTSIIQCPKKLVDQSRAVEHDAQLNIAAKILQGEEEKKPFYKLYQPKINYVYTPNSIY